MTTSSGRSTSIAILNCGVGNIGSIFNSLSRQVGRPSIIAEPEDLFRFQTIILPGVGSFGGFMSRLRDRGFESALIEHSAKPENKLIGICVGMQVLLEAGHEHGRHRGLGLVPGTVEKISCGDSSCRIPHVGWNSVRFDDAHFNSLGGDYYFTHSYAAVTEGAYVLGTTEHGTSVIAAVKHRNILGFQFHPEKSGRRGIDLLQFAVEWEGESD